MSVKALKWENSWCVKLLQGGQSLRIEEEKGRQEGEEDEGNRVGGQMICIR